MIRTTTSTFDVTGWIPAPYTDSDPDPRLSRAHVTKQFKGSIDGSSEAEVMLCMSDPDDYKAGAGYIGSEKFEGSVDGLDGSFVFHHGGLSGGDQPDRTYGSIIPGTGTGKLEGINGTTEINRSPEGDHSITLTYSLPD